jgi:hypothetical protein
MLAFTTPAALWGLAALAVPIALHLWSRRAGRPVRVGSIALFAGAPPPVARRLRLADPWLLALRCAVLATLVGALAGPVWHTGARADGTTWVLVAPEVLADSSSAARLDSLIDGHAERRLLAGGLPPLTPSDRAAATSVRIRPTDPWSLLREAAFLAPPGTRFVVVAPAALPAPAGDRPVLRNPVTWIPLGPAPAAPRAAMPPAARLVRVYSDAERREDARYVAAALEAAAAATGIPAVVSSREAAAPPHDVAEHADWIVWLAARPPPGELQREVRGGATLLVDAGGAAPVERAGELRTITAHAGGPVPTVWRRAGLSNATGPRAPLWTDDRGTALLTAERLGAGVVLRFDSRFHPAWSDLVLLPAFPQAVAALWAEPGPEPPPRRLTATQILPDRASGSGPRPAGPTRDLYHLFWLAAVVLFFWERRLAR